MTRFPIYSCLYWICISLIPIVNISSLKRNIPRGSNVTVTASMQWLIFLLSIPKSINSNYGGCIVRWLRILLVFLRNSIKY
jgi:hypothetical protein